MELTGAVENLIGRDLPYNLEAERRAVLGGIAFGYVITFNCNGLFKA